VEAIAWAPATIRTVSEPAGYSGTPLPRKLGIKAEQHVRLVGAPDSFDLGELPAGVTVSRADEPSGWPDVTLLFCRDRATLERWFGPLKAELAASGTLWVAWQKKASKVPTGLGEHGVREHGLAGGLVDVKICAIDAVWSGIKFVYRLSDRPNVSRTQA
jgi:hypothetical protein